MEAVNQQSFSPQRINGALGIAKRAAMQLAEQADGVYLFTRCVEAAHVFIGAFSFARIEATKTQGVQSVVHLSFDTCMASSPVKEATREGSPKQAVANCPRLAHQQDKRDAYPSSGEEG